MLCALGLGLFSACTSEGGSKEAASTPATVAATSLTAAAPDTTTNAVATTAPKDSTATGDSTAAKAPAEVPVKDEAADNPGAILPHKRIVAFYGNPLSKRMGILGEIAPEKMLAKLDSEVKAWNAADPSTPVQPALHLVFVTAQGKPGKGGTYRLRMSDHLADTVIAWAAKRNAIVFLDIQIGQSTVEQELPRLEKYLKLPQVHLGIDPEFAMKNGAIPGRKIGTLDAKEINYATSFLNDIAVKYDLPPKILVVHRFTQRMVTNYKDIQLRPNVQFVMHMDGWGDRVLKKSTYLAYIKREPVQYTGFKIFYHNDTKKPGSKLYTPEGVLALSPKPLYIQYQ
ncbi:lipoprotein [Rufibacter glacialis]|nr:lipoprotein [Rufibacter glacialis]